MQTLTVRHPALRNKSYRLEGEKAEQKAGICPPRCTHGWILVVPFVPDQPFYLFLALRREGFDVSLEATRPHSPANTSMKPVSRQWH